jgi:hypothetical protein
MMREGWDPVFSRVLIGGNSDIQHADNKKKRSHKQELSRVTMPIASLEIGHGEESQKPKRLTPKDFILYESSENSSGRCAGFIVLVLAIIFSDILFGKYCLRFCLKIYIHGPI